MLAEEYCGNIWEFILHQVSKIEENADNDFFNADFCIDDKNLIAYLECRSHFNEIIKIALTANNALKS